MSGRKTDGLDQTVKNSGGGKRRGPVGDFNVKQGESLFGRSDLRDRKKGIK